MTEIEGYEWTLRARKTGNNYFLADCHHEGAEYKGVKVFGFYHASVGQDMVCRIGEHNYNHVIPVHAIYNPRLNPRQEYNIIEASKMLHDNPSRKFLDVRFDKAEVRLVMDETGEIKAYHASCDRSYSMSYNNLQTKYYEVLE